MHLDASQAAAAHNAQQSGPRLLMLCGSSVLGAALGNWLLFDELPGINWTVWILLCSTGFLFWARSGGRALGAQRSIFLALACVLSVGAAITASPWLHLAVFGSLVLLASWTIVSSPAPLPMQELGRVIGAPPLALLRILQADQQFMTEAGSALGVRRNLAAVRGSLIAAPIVMVFFLLLSAADPTLAGWRDTFVDSVSDWSFAPRVVFFLVLGVALLGAYHIALRHCPEAALPVTNHDVVRRGVLEGTERLIVLAAVAVLFALFLVLQVSYLFSNPGALPGSGVTFAEAAHRGFGELTVTVLLTAALIVVLDRLAQRGSAEPAVKYCALLLIAESIPMLLSANSRIGHYEAAYGYTLPRLYVHVYIGLACIGMVLLARQVWGRIELGRLVQQTAIGCMLVLALLCFWNHGAWIVAKNVERYAATQKLDLDHLEWLAANLPDSIPQLVASVPKLRDAEALQLRALLYQRWSAASRRSLDASGEVREARWYRWNLRRVEAQEALQRLAGSGPL